MIKITMSKDETGVTLHVEGKLCGIAAEALESSWKRSLGPEAGPVTVLLASVTFISPEGRKLLVRMHEEGVQLRAAGCATRGVVAEITGREPGAC